jgi:hypothetical protein
MHKVYINHSIAEMSRQMARTYTSEQLRIIIRTNDPILPYVQSAKNALRIQDTKTHYPQAAKSALGSLLTIIFNPFL